MIGAENFWELLKQRAETNTDAQFLIDPVENKNLTFGEFLIAVEQYAQNLFDEGVRQNSIVAWQLPTGIDAIVVMFALSRLGAIQAPIIHLYREREITEILTQTKPSHLLVIGNPEDSGPMDRAQIAVDSVAEQFKTQLVDIAGFDEDKKLDLPPYQAAEDEVRWYYFTSGTTARPKGARHTDKSLLSAARFYGDVLDMTSDDVGVIAYPVGHIGASVYSSMALEYGLPILLLNRYVPELVIPNYRKYGVTAAGGSTAHYQMLLTEQRKQPNEPLFPNLRIIAGGGAAKPAALYQQVKDEMGVKIIHAYGMTEAPITSSNTPHDSDEQLMHSDGIVLPGLELKIVDSKGVEVSQGSSGEIVLRGPNLCQGYLLEEQTKAAFDEDGFYHTGDLGCMHDDGHIEITGRLKEVIIRKGENISAREVEDLLAQHPLLKDAAVIGLPCEERGEMVCAVVELANPDDEFSFSQMQEFLKSKELMRQKIPERLEVVDELPRNEGLQKVKKNELVDRFKG